MKKYIYAFGALSTMAALAVAMPALAEDNNNGQVNLQLNSSLENNNGHVNSGVGFGLGLGKEMNRGEKGIGMMGSGVYGTVSAVSGNNITITSTRGMGANAITTTFTVDATNAKIYKNNSAGTIASIAVGDTVIVQGKVTGTNIVATVIRDGQMMTNRDKQGVTGVVSAVSGNTITVTRKQGPKDLSATAVTVTYTIDATNAKITKNGVAGTIASITVGDTIMAQGTLTGTNLVATMIRDGASRDDGKDNGQPTITGNGQPVIIGTVSAVSGSTLTVTNKSNVTYTVDATNAKITEGQNTILVSNVAVGDMVIVQGTFSGNSVVASNIIDQTKPAKTDHKNEGGGFFGGIGSFFAHLFGF